MPSEPVAIGTSTARTIPYVIQWMQDLQPRSILDVGCGWGRWGVLAREVLELWYHRYRPNQWEVHIQGVDINPFNWTPLHDYVYDRVYTDDIRRHAPEYAELVIATDVMEHMAKDEAWQTLEMLQRYSAYQIVGVPIGPGWARGGFDNNPFEAHVSAWEFEELASKAVTSVALETEDPLPYGLFLLRSR